MDNRMEICLECDALREMRRSLDNAIRRGVAGMEQKKASACTILLRLDINSYRYQEMNEQTGEACWRSPIHFGHECKTSIRFEEKDKGCCTESYELLGDGMIARANEQLSMLEE